MLNDSRWLLRGSTVKTFNLLLIKNDWAVLFSILSYLTYYKPKTCLLYPHKCLFKHVSTQLVPIYHKLYLYLQFSTTDRNWHLNIWRVFQLFVTVCHVEWHQNSAQSSHSDLELRYRMLPSPSLCPFHSPPIYPCCHPCRCRPFIRTYCNCNFNLASLLLSAALDQKPFYFVVKCTMCIFDLKLDSTPLSLSPSPAAHAHPSTSFSAINNCAAVSYEKKAKVFDSFLAVHNHFPPLLLHVPPACPLHCPCCRPCNLCVVNNILAQL